jgi:lipopolysaccharide transport system permease protein
MVMSAGRALAGELLQFRRVLLATTRLDLLKKYAGSGLGWAWIALYPLLFLGAYMVVFMVIFRTAPPGMTNVGYVALVFSGLVPFLALMDTINVSVVAIRQNIHFLKNVIMPIEIVAVKPVLMALVSEVVGIVLLGLLAGINGDLGSHLLLLPFVLVLQFMLLVGIAMALAPLGVLIPDLAHIMSIVVFLLMFVSPIAFRTNAVPAGAHFLVVLNPATYLIDAFRAAMLSNQPLAPVQLAIFAAMSIGMFELGARIFRRFKATIVEYE